ncbi:MAG: cation:proton antiporter [Elusimicrobia bacterium]|nr:cation:proton antiporter [Elusimicrobiota bacterium]
MIQVYFWVLLICCFLCIYRIGRGPTPPDRAVAIDLLGTVVVGFSALFTLVSNSDFYMNVAISWTLLSFMGSIAIAKYLEAKSFDE